MKLLSVKLLPVLLVFGMIQVAVPAGSSDAVAAPKTTAPKATSQKTAVKTTSISQPGKLLYDAWYTVTVNKKLHYGYYNDHVELKDGRIFFKNHYWKQEEGFLNEEQLGAVAENDAALTPLFFNFHTTYRSNEATVDGTFEKGGMNARMLSVKVRKGSADQPVIRKSVADRVFLSTFFPIWAGRNLSAAKEGQPLSLLLIFEDGADPNFAPVSGIIRLQKQDELAKKTHTTKISATIQDRPSIWYFDQQGVPVRIEMTDQGIVVEKVPESAAKSFLSVN